jgi:hypothetical protein
VCFAFSCFKKIYRFGDTMGERIGRIGRMRTDFFLAQMHEFQAKKSKNPCQSARSAQSVLPSYPQNHPMRSKIVNFAELFFELMQLFKKRYSFAPSNLKPTIESIQRPHYSENSKNMIIE